MIGRRGFLSLLGGAAAMTLDPWSRSSRWGFRCYWRGMNIKRVENLHVALWLAKDTSWCSGWEVPAFLMVVPTVWVAVRIAWHSRNDAEDLVHNVAVCLWIMANLVWMTGEFFFDDGTRPLARVFFYAGMALLAVYYLGKGARTWRAAR